MKRAALGVAGLFAILALPLFAGPAPASSLAAMSKPPLAVAADDPSPLVVPAAARRQCPPFCEPYVLQHRKFHERYSPKQPHFLPAHRRFHHVHHHPHHGPYIYFRHYPGFYDPFFYNPYFYDPYYDVPRHAYRMSCSKAAGLLRHNGYRNVKAVDCVGKTYAFTVVKAGQRYRVTVRASDGAIIARKRI